MGEKAHSARAGKVRRTEDRIERACRLFDRAESACDAGDDRAAERLLGEALSIFEAECGPNHPTVHTETGVVMGTTSYMSPEQAKGMRVDARSDAFSSGVVLYELVTGEIAFQRDSAVETLHAIVYEDPPKLAALGRTLPAGLARVLRRCLEKDPERRY